MDRWLDDNWPTNAAHARSQARAAYFSAALFMLFGMLSLAGGLLERLVWQRDSVTSWVIAPLFLFSAAVSMVRAMDLRQTYQRLADAASAEKHL